MSNRSPLRRLNSRRAVAHIVLGEGVDLPLGKYSDPKVYCFLKLGSQYEESKESKNYTFPQWRQSFEFDIYDGKSKTLQIFVRHRISNSPNGENIGQVTLDLDDFKPDVTTYISKDVIGTECGKIRLIVTISGTDEETQHENWEVLKSFLQRETSISYKNFRSRNVGYLVLYVHKAENLPVKLFGNKPDPFCLIKTCNNIFRTQTIYHTTEPIWNKFYEMDVDDITSSLKISLFDECNRNNHHTIGNLNIPLLQIHNNGRMWYDLTKKESKGTSHSKRSNGKSEPKILLECFVFYNTAKAVLAAFQKRNDALEAPKQHKIHFRKKVVEAHIEELKVLYKYFGIELMKSELKSVIKWDNKLKSTISLFLYIGFVYIFEPWMISCLLLFVFLKNCYDNNLSQNHTSMANLESNNSENNTENSNDVQSSSENEDEAIDIDDKKEKKSIFAIIEKVINVINVSREVQTSLGQIVRFGQRLQNMLEFKIPFLSSIVATFLVLLTFLLWMIPLRYLIIAVGVKVMLKGLIFPNSTSFHTRLRIFMSKFPDHEEIKSYALPKQIHSDSQNLTKEQGLPALEWRQDLDGQIPSPCNYDIKHGINLMTKAYLPNLVRNMLTTSDYANRYNPIVETSEPTNLEETEEGESNKMEVASELELLSNEANSFKPIITVSKYKDKKDRKEKTPKRHRNFKKWKSMTNFSVDQESLRVGTNRAPRIMIDERKFSFDNGLLNPNPKSPDVRRRRWAETETMPRRYSFSS